MKKIWALVLAGGLLLNMQPAHAEVAKQPEIFGQYAIAMDAITGEVYYGKNEKEKAYPASLTKVMTALLLDEKVKETETITATEHAVGQEASQAYFKLKAGEKLSKQDALNAMMVISANDVAMSVGEHIGGSQEQFGVMMTNRAKEIGANETNFTNPNGLTDPNHYTTAYDMALITREAIQYPEVLKAMGTKEVKLVTDAKTMDVKNPSKIHDNPEVIGGKTGYTNAAANCLVEVFERDGKRVITVVMKSSLNAEYTDLQSIADYAFSQMHLEPVVKKGDIVGTSTINEQKVSVTSAEDFSITLPEGVTAAQAVTPKVTLDPLESVNLGDVAGKIEYSYKGNVVKKVDLLAASTVVAKVKKEDVKAAGETSYWKVFLIAVIVPIPFYVFYLVRYNRKRRQKLWGLEDEGVS